MTAKIWVKRKESRNEIAGAFCGSLIIHTLLFFLMASTSIYYPATGEIAQFDIFWLSPASSPMEAPNLATVPEIVTAANVKPEQPDVKPDNVEPPQLPVVDKNTEPPAQRPHEQTEKEPPVELIVARAVQIKQPSPPVKPPPKPKKTAELIPKAEPKREKSVKEAETPAKSQTAKPETRPEAKHEPPPPPPAQPPLPPEKTVAAIVEEQRQAALSATHERMAQEKAERQRQADERAEQEQRAAEAAREKAEQKRRTAEAVKEKANQERQTAEAASLKAEQEQLAAERLRQEKRVREREQAAAEAAREKALQKRRAAETAKEKAEQERLAKLKAEREQLAAAQLQQEKLARERAERIKITAENAERERLAAAENRQSTEQESLAAERARLATVATLASAQPSQRAVEMAPKETHKPRPAEKPPEARGIIIPSIHGDLKLIITESNDIRLTVLFREYPKTRWNRGLTHSEARREQKITPIVVKTKEKTREAVIEKAREGIYIFTTEPDGAPSATATFTLKSYEQSQRAKTQPLGTKTIAGKAIVARILMPDAILWEDESAFTGSMQDSGGVTKFNSETGLIWKEYSD